MRTVLQIITNDATAVTAEVLSGQLPETLVTRFDLTAPEADYEQLLERIFEADSVQVW